MFQKSIYHTLLETEVENMRDHWFRRYPRGYFAQFIREGLIPFVKSHGYHINHDFPTLVNHFTEWMWSHKKVALIKEKYHREYHIHYKNGNNHGYQDDYIWFCSAFPSDELCALLEPWSKTEFFDQSIVGQAQELDFLNFLWNNVDLHASKAHQPFYEMQDEHEDEDGETDTPSTKQYDFID